MRNPLFGGKPHISLILPAYNEEETLQETVTRIHEVMNSYDKSYEIIFVNDGSTDATRQILQAMHDVDHRVKIINFSRNFGHQTAVSAGLAKASGDYAAVLDADLQDPPEVLPQFFDRAKEGYDVVYAIRKKRKESALKKLGYTLFYRFLSRVSHIDIPLDSGDFCVMSARTVAALNALPERNRFVRGLRSWVGYRQVGMEYERSARFAGESKYPFSKLVKLAFDGIFSFSYVPLHFISWLGSSAMLLAFVGSVWAIYQRFFTENYDAVPGFATTIILVMFIGGLQLFSLGIVGEYMRRMYDEIKARPQYIVDSEIGF